MGYKPPTIEEVGLKNYLIQKGVDYEEFCKRDDLNEPNTIIARALSPDPEKPLDYRTIANWREVRKKESSNG